MLRFICQLPETEQEKIRSKVIKYLNNIEEGLAFKKDEFGETNIDNVMNDTISNLDNMLYA